MSTLPLLKTGAVTQYPAIMVQQFSTDIVVFLDGTEQRNRNWPLAQKRWLIDLSLLDDREVRKIEEFFIAESGRYASFAFAGNISCHCLFSTTVSRNLVRSIDSLLIINVSSKKLQFV